MNRAARKSPRHQPRWRRRSGQRPAEIVDAALEVFARQGFEAARMDEIAGRAGVSKGTVYLYYPSKEALFKACLESSLKKAGQVFRSMEKLEPASPKMLTRRRAASILVDMLESLSEYLARKETLSILGLTIARHGRPHRGDIKDGLLLAEGTDVLADFLASAHKAHVVECHNPAETARLLVAVLLGMSVMRTFLDSGDDSSVTAQTPKAFRDFALNIVGLDSEGRKTC